MIYGYMQAVGMVNDHLVSCFRYQDCVHREIFSCNSNE
jgi:3-methyladenine DNA glycosylase Tag